LIPFKDAVLLKIANRVRLKNFRPQRHHFDFNSVQDETSPLRGLIGHCGIVRYGFPKHGAADGVVGSQVRIGRGRERRGRQTRVRSRSHRYLDTDALNMTIDSKDWTWNESRQTGIVEALQLDHPLTRLLWTLLGRTRTCLRLPLSTSLRSNRLCHRLFLRVKASCWLSTSLGWVQQLILLDDAIGPDSSLGYSGPLCRCSETF